MKAALTKPVDTIIVGAGLAGACSALALSTHQRVLVLDAATPPAGASLVAAGIVDPFTGLRVRLLWQGYEAIAAFMATLQEAGATTLYRATGVLRPAADAAQASRYQKIANSYSENTLWLSQENARKHFPGLIMHSGALLVKSGGMVYTDKFVRAILTACKKRGVILHTNISVDTWGEDENLAYVTSGQQRFHARRVLLTMGYGYHRFGELKRLNLQALKGQLLHVTQPPAKIRLPIAGWGGYVAPFPKTLVVGTSYERNFTHSQPTPEETQNILERASTMWPPLRTTRILDTFAGVRVTTPGTRLPSCGPLPGRKKIWILTGLGSNGILLGSLLGRNIPAYFARPHTIPDRIRTTNRNE